MTQIRYTGLGDAANSQPDPSGSPVCLFSFSDKIYYTLSAQKSQVCTQFHTWFQVCEFLMDPSIPFIYSPQPAYSLVFSTCRIFPGGSSRDFFSCLFPPPVLQSKSVNGMQREGERPGAAIKFNHLMTKTRLRGSPCSGLRGSQKGSTAPCRGKFFAACQHSA